MISALVMKWEQSQASPEQALKCLRQICVVFQIGQQCDWRLAGATQLHQPCAHNTHATQMVYPLAVKCGMRAQAPARTQTEP